MSAYEAGQLTGALLAPLVMAMIFRGVYVLIRRDRPFWSWSIAAMYGPLALLSIIGQQS